MQYQVSFSDTLSEFGFFAALRARSLSGVVRAETSTLPTAPSRPRSVWAAGSWMNTPRSASSPVVTTPVTVKSWVTPSRVSVKESPTPRPRAAA